MRKMWMSALRMLLAGAAFAAVAAGQGYTMNTYAGGGPVIGESATNVALPHPNRIAVNSTGIYFTTVAGAGLGTAYPNLGSNGMRAYVMNASGTITMVIGNGISGYAGDGGPAANAELDGPSGICVDSSGNIYIADAGNNRIRKVTASTGVITTVAGNGTAGFSGDGGPATSAELDGPEDVAVDSSGNIYIADQFNERIRKVTASTGVITTVAGNGTAGFSGDTGPATSAELNIPSSIALDSSGNIYVADNGNSRIRKVTASTGVITTVTGALTNFTSVAVDSSGNIYTGQSEVGDEIHKWTASTGVATTVAGNETLGFSGDGGPATSAELAEPYGVAVDSSGNIYIADKLNNRIRMVTASTGIITTVAGNGSGLDSGDGGPATAAQLGGGEGDGIQTAVDANGNVYISSLYRVREVTAATGVITTVAGNGTAGFSGDGGPATSAEIDNLLGGVAVDSGGNIYFADQLNERIRKVTASTGIITTVAGTGTAGFSGDTGPATSAELNIPSSIALDSSGNIYFADQLNERIRKVTASTGIITTVAGTGTAGFSGDGGPATSARLSSPQGVALDSSGNIYIADAENHRIRMVTASTGIITTIAGTGTAGFSGDGGPATNAELDNPFGVAVDSSGNILIANHANRIRMVAAATGIITTIAGTGTAGFSGDGGPATSAELSSPVGVAVDSLGNVYIADSGNLRVRSLTPGSIQVTVTSNPPGLALTVDGAAVTTPYTFTATTGFHTFNAATQSGGTGTQYILGPGGPVSVAFQYASGATQTYSPFTTQYYLTTSAGANGSISPASGWYNAGTVVPVSATPANGYAFSGFGGALTGLTTPQNLTMTGPLSVSASFGLPQTITVTQHGLRWPGATLSSF